MDKFKGIAKGGWHSGEDGGTKSSGSSTSGAKDRFKGIAKGGWHPETGEGGWKTGFGLRGGKDPYAEQRENHVSAPLSALKDPDSFGPPPKHQHFYGAAATTRGATPPPGGLGARVPSPTRKPEQLTAQEEEEPAVPTGPFRADTTGLRTDNLPKPPIRRNDGSPAPTSSPASRPVPTPPPRNKPGLPPRLPPRQDEYPTENAPLPPPTYQEAITSVSDDQGGLNSAAVGRLGQAGVSVPGFGIASTSTPPESPQRGPQLSELQNRVSRMNTGSANTGEPQSSQGTTWKQKQDALKSASSLRTDPSSISMSDARNAASTANNFQQRHGAQVSALAQGASGLNSKYGISQRLGGVTTQSQQGSTTIQSSPLATPTSSAGKKAPPPPPPKKSGLNSVIGLEHGSSVPPPLPLSSKPRPPT